MEMPPLRPRNQPWITESEWEQRLQMAACLRLFAALGWGDGVGHHVSLKLVSDLPTEDRFLLNPLGLPYEEASAGKLVQVDADGHITSPTRYQVDIASFKVLAQVHSLREDALCVMQIQEPWAVALACKPSGLRQDNFYSASFVDRLAHIDFSLWREGQTEALGRIVGQSDALVLRQRGLATIGYDIASAFWLLWNLQRACEVQLLADQAGGSNIPMGIDEARSFAQSSAINQQDYAELAFSSALKRYGIEFADLADT
jgi:ribulose-5-phosphate 4-epimerase/fuculose-1-phosphate aldolase